MNKKFLVTGGAGFIGSNLCEALLARGYQVRCLDNLSTGKYKNIEPLLESADFEFIEGTITDFQTCLSAVAGVDYVLHQAAFGSVPRSMKYPLMYQENNVMGTLNMLEASVQNKIKKFVYASSSSVYGSAKELPKKEGQEGSVLSPYALTKKINEEYGKLYSDVYQLPTVGLRYFNVFGRKQNPEGPYAAVIPKFIESLISNQSPIINGDGNQSRDFTFIKNVVTANIQAAFSSDKTNGRAYNIACNDQISLNQLYDILANLLGKQEMIPTYGPKRAGDIEHSYANIERAKKDFGYQVLVPFAEGIRDTVSWYLQSNIQK